MKEPRKTPAFQGNTPGEIAVREEAETVTLTIDGHEVTVPTGTNILEAARTVGIEIPAFCYHPGLSVVAVCRQCLVKVEKWPKPAPACHATCADGMVVNTKDPEVQAIRKQMLEMTLLNHPIDCPVCDKAGECTLQELYHDNGFDTSRADTPKVNKPKRVDLGEKIVLDAERCIICTRCIRVCDEVAGEHELDMIHRGDHTALTVAPGAALENPYALNTVDVCPVGALTSKDFRFALRAWELMMTPSICTGCSTGCNIEIHHREGRVHRLVPRFHPQINKHWMCDEGRFTYQELAMSRLAVPLKAGLPASWDAASSDAAALIGKALEQSRDRVGLVFSAVHSNEDNYALARLARDFWQAERVYIIGRTPVSGRDDGILRDSDVNPNRRGVAAILGKEAAASGASVLEQDLLAGDLSALVVLGGEVPISAEAMQKATALDALVVLSTHETELAQGAHVALPVCAWAEVNATVVNRDGIVQRLREAVPGPGQAAPAWSALLRIGRATGATLEYSKPKEIFDEMTKELEELAGADWGKPAPLIQLRFAHSRG